MTKTEEIELKRAAFVEGYLTTASGNKLTAPEHRMNAERYAKQAFPSTRQREITVGDITLRVAADGSIEYNSLLTYGSWRQWTSKEKAEAVRSLLNNPTEDVNC